MDLRNTYVRVHSPEESKAIQEKAFEMGFKWAGKGPVVCHTEKPVIVFWEDMYICHSHDQNPNSHFVTDHKYSEVLASDIISGDVLKIETQKEEGSREQLVEKAKEELTVRLAETLNVEIIARTLAHKAGMPGMWKDFRLRLRQGFALPAKIKDKT